MELVQRMEEFIREKYYAELLRAAKEDRALVIDFSELDRFDPITSDQLLESPRDVIGMMKKAAESFGLDEKVNVRVRNLPESRNIRIRNLRAKHMNRLWCVDAIIKAASEVKPQIYEATFICPECGTKISMPQEGNIIQKAAVCQCGRRGDFGEPVEKKMFDVRWLTGVEPFEITTGEQPGEIRVILREDLTTPKMQKKTDPGSRLRIVGILVEAPKHIKGRLSTKMDMFFEALHVETKDVEFEDMDITPDDEARIKELAADPNIYERLKMSIAPGIYGFDEIKESIALQLFGGIKHRLPDGNTIRGNIHILLTGDPGIGKSVTGSSRILHNSDDAPEYTTIENLVDVALKKDRTVLENGTEIAVKNDKNVKVLALDPGTLEMGWKPVTAFIRHESPEFLVKVRTKSGREVIATEDHGFVVMNDEGDVVDTQGSSMRKGMFLPIPMGMHRELLNEISIEQALMTNAKKMPGKIKLDWNFGFFMGMFLSEGSLGSGVISIESANEPRKTEIKRFFDSMGLSSHTNSHRIIMSSRNFARFLEKNCYKGGKTGKGKGSGAVRKCIPDFCFYAPKNFIEGLLSGIFSGDGYFLNSMPRGKNRTKGSLKLELTTISPHLACGTLEILSLAGIFAVMRQKSYTYKNAKRDKYEVTIIGNHVGELMSKIKMIGNPEPKISRFSEKDSFDLIPCTALLYGIVKKLGFSRRLVKDSGRRRAFSAMMRTVKSRKKIGRRRLERIYNELVEEAKSQGNGPALRDLSKLKEILDANVIWDCVESVERMESKEKYVYDLSVDGYQTFVVNNLVIHNSMFLKLISNIVPRGKYVSGSGVTGAGMTATVRKDEVLGGWVLEAGALILANKGVISIDEFDKISRDDQIAMHEAMSIETVSIAKASIVATLPAETAVLAGANPKFGRFDPYLPIADQITIPETLLSIAYDEPIMIRKNGKISAEKIGEFVDKFYDEGKYGFPIKIKGIEACAMNNKFKLEWWPVRYVFRHPVKDNLLEIEMNTGRNILLSRGHSIYVFEEGEIKTKPSDKIKVGDYIVIPKKLPQTKDHIKAINLAEEILSMSKENTENIFLHNVPESAVERLGIEDKNWRTGNKLPLIYYKKLRPYERKKCMIKYKGGAKEGVPVEVSVSKELMRLLGYYIAEGSITLSTSSEHLISFCVNSKETEIINDLKRISRKLFNHRAKTIHSKNSVKVNIANKIAYLFLKDIIKAKRGAHNKRVPEIVFNLPPQLQKEFILAYFKGDYGVTVSKYLMSDLLLLLLQNGIIASFKKWAPREVTFPDGHRCVSKEAYAISDSPKRMKEFKSIKWYKWVPLQPVLEYLKPLSNRKFMGSFSGYPSQYITGEKWWRKYFLRKYMLKTIKWLRVFETPYSIPELTKKIFKIQKENKNFINKLEIIRPRINHLFKKGLLERRKICGFYTYSLSQLGRKCLNVVENIEKLIGGDLGFVKVTKISEVSPENKYVYDLSTPGHENFIAGFGGALCHNSRFDLKFALKDRPDRTQDERLADHIIMSRTRPDMVEPAINTALLRKYIAYAKNIMSLELTPEASQKLKEFYVDMRNRYTDEESHTISITLRQYEALIRMAEASAKIRLSGRVEAGDAERAINLMKYSLSQLGYDYETGRIDIDRVEGGVPAGKRRKIHQLIEIIETLQKTMKDVPIEDVKAEAESQGIENIDEIIEKLKSDGILFEPRIGFIKKAR